MENVVGTTNSTAGEHNSSERSITMTEKQLTALIKAVVTEVVAAAVTDIRQGEAAIIKSITDQNNTLMGLKNAQIAMNKTLNERKNGRGAVVYINNNNTPPNDLFGNNAKDPVENCD